MNEYDGLFTKEFKKTCKELAKFSEEMKEIGFVVDEPDVQRVIDENIEDLKRISKSK